MVKEKVVTAPKEIPSEWGDRDEFKWDNLGRSRRLQRKAEQLIINSCPIEVGKAESLIRYKLGISGRRILNEFIIPLVDMGIISLKDGKLYVINKLINVKDIKLCNVCGYKEPSEKCIEDKCKNLMIGGEDETKDNLGKEDEKFEFEMPTPKAKEIEVGGFEQWKDRTDLNTDIGLFPFSKWSKKEWLKVREKEPANKMFWTPLEIGFNKGKEDEEEDEKEIDAV